MYGHIGTQHIEIYSGSDRGCVHISGMSDRHQMSMWATVTVTARTASNTTKGYVYHHYIIVMLIWMATQYLIIIIIVHVHVHIIYKACLCLYCHPLGVNFVCGKREAIDLLRWSNVMLASYTPHKHINVYIY